MRIILACLTALLTGITSAALHAEESPSAVYEQLKAFELGGRVFKVDNLDFERDRVKMSLTGEVYFAKPVLDRVTGGVFVGKGRLKTEPWSDFEKGNLQRLLKSDVIEVDFKTAVFRFTDDSFDVIAEPATAGSGWSQRKAAELASKLGGRLVRETGLNLSSRLLLSLTHDEKPGFFFAQFDGGKRGRFCVVIDHQARVPGNVFGVDGGEKGLVFQYSQLGFDNDIWTAFYSQTDFNRGAVEYSDVFDIVHITQYRMNIDLVKPNDWLRYDAELDVTALRENVKLIPLKINEGLSEYEGMRLEKGVKLLDAALADGTPLGILHDDWESGVTVVLPKPLAKGSKITVRLELEGKDTLSTYRSFFHYPRSTTSWYPRHGHLARSEFDLTFHHREKTKVVSVGERLEEKPDPENEKTLITRWRMTHPVALVTFAVGKFDLHEEKAEVAGEEIPIEFYSLGSFAPIKEDFLLAELSNGVRYFSDLFGDYPYGRLGAVYFPRRYGQGFPSMLLLPSPGEASTHSFAFISHEGAHQWWGNIVGWRSYADQWMSEGFAEYSGILYAWKRQGFKQSLELVRKSRRSLIQPPKTDTGILAGTVSEIGPLILGQRLSSRRSRGAYSTLIYQKGALVLRMLHFLFTDPGDGDMFYEMMRDFVERHRNDLATTETFQAVASEHFKKTKIAQTNKILDLDWFFQQWVYQTALPTYRLEYSVGKQGGEPVLQCTLYQEGAPEDWGLPLPLTLDFGGKQVGRTIVVAYGPKRNFALPLPAVPQKVTLDPDLWVLSRKTTTKKVKR